MVKVQSSRGGQVSVEIRGLAETLAYLRRKGKDIENAEDLGVAKAANFVQAEVQESIIGNRAEPKSVDTGRFGNSLRIDKIKNAEFKIFVEESEYPEQPGTTTKDVAKKLEFGTSKFAPRMHFRNSVARSQNEAKNIIKEAIKKAL